MNSNRNLAKRWLSRFYGRLLLVCPLLVGVAIAA